MGFRTRGLEAEVKNPVSKMTMTILAQGTKIEHQCTDCPILRFSFHPGEKSPGNLKKGDGEMDTQKHETPCNPYPDKLAKPQNWT